MSEKFLLGINYWPRMKAQYWWKAFDAAGVAEDFAQIRDLGLDVVRFFMLWEDFQVGPDRMNAETLVNLDQVFAIAQEHGLRLQPAFFTGHMSGYNWAPAWALLDEEDPDAHLKFPMVANGQVTRKKIRDMYQDPWLLRAQIFNVRQVVPRYAGHPALYGWDLGNEPDVFIRPRSREAGWLWNTLICSEIKRLDPLHPVSTGIHIWSLDQGTLRPDDMTEATDFGIMHAYSIYCDAARFPMDPDVVPFCNALTQHLGGKPVLFQEFGTCTAGAGAAARTERITLEHRQWDQYFASEDEAETYFGAVLERLWRVGSLGAFAWCWADYHESLWDRPPCDKLIHERFFGLVRSDGSYKPHAKVLQAFASEQRNVNPQPQRFEFGGIAPDPYFQDPAASFKRLYQGFSVDMRTAARA